MYFKGIASGNGFLHSLWPQQVKKAAAKYAKKDDPAAAIRPPEQDPAARKIESLRARLKAGKRLSPAEMDFLREYAPELYAKAVRVSMERDEYERALRRAKTQGDAERVQNLKMVQISERLKHMDPEEGEMLTNAVAEANREYRKSDEYQEAKGKNRSGVEKNR